MSAVPAAIATVAIATLVAPIMTIAASSIVATWCAVAAGIRGVPVRAHEALVASMILLIAFV